MVENSSRDFTNYRDLSDQKLSQSDQKLSHLSDFVSGEFKTVESKIESLRGVCSNESVVRHLVSAIENANAEMKVQQNVHKIFVENTRAEMLALHSKVEGLLKEKHSDKPAVFTTTIATMPSELDAMRYSMEQTRKDMISASVKQKRVEELLGQKADLRQIAAILTFLFIYFFPSDLLLQLHKQFGAPNCWRFCCANAITRRKGAGKYKFGSSSTFQVA
jgi:hypothetical protein